MRKVTFHKADWVSNPQTLVVVQLLSCVWVFVTLQTATCLASLSFTISRGLLELIYFGSVMPSNHLILCHPFSSCPQSFPASRSFPMSRLFITGGQHIRPSASASVLPMNIQGWFPLGLTGFISLLSLVSNIMQCLGISADQSERVCMEDLNRIPMWRNGPKEGHQEWHNFRPLRKLSIFIDILRYDFLFPKMIETSDRSEEDLGWGSTSFPLVSQATEPWVWRTWLYFRSSEWWS